MAMESRVGDLEKGKDMGTSFIQPAQPAHLPFQQFPQQQFPPQQFQQFPQQQFFQPIAVPIPVPHGSNFKLMGDSQSSNPFVV